MRKGIENLFENSLFEDFIDTQNRKIKISIPDSTYLDRKEFNWRDDTQKRDFCNFICNRNNIDDFKNFRPIFEMIEEIINPKTSTEEKLDDKQSE